MQGSPLYSNHASQKTSGLAGMLINELTWSLDLTPQLNHSHRLISSVIMWWLQGSNFIPLCSLPMECDIGEMMWILF